MADGSGHVVADPVLLPGPSPPPPPPLVRAVASVVSSAPSSSSSSRALAPPSRIPPALLTLNRLWTEHATRALQHRCAAARTNAKARATARRFPMRDKHFSPSAALNAAVELLLRRGVTVDTPLPELIEALDNPTSCFDYRPRVAKAFQDYLHDLHGDPTVFQTLFASDPCESPLSLDGPRIQLAASHVTLANLLCNPLMRALPPAVRRHFNAPPLLLTLRHLVREARAWRPLPAPPVPPPDATYAEDPEDATERVRALEASVRRATQELRAGEKALADWFAWAHTSALAVRAQRERASVYGEVAQGLQRALEACLADTETGPARADTDLAQRVRDQTRAWLDTDTDALRRQAAAAHARGDAAEHARLTTAVTWAQQDIAVPRDGNADLLKAMHDLAQQAWVRWKNESPWLARPADRAALEVALCVPVLQARLREALREAEQLLQSKLPDAARSDGLSLEQMAKDRHQLDLVQARNARPDRTQVVQDQQHAFTVGAFVQYRAELYKRLMAGIAGMTQAEVRAHVERVLERERANPQRAPWKRPAELRVPASRADRAALLVTEEDTAEQLIGEYASHYRAASETLTSEARDHERDVLAAFPRALTTTPGFRMPHDLGFASWLWPRDHWAAFVAEAAPLLLPGTSDHHVYLTAHSHTPVAPAPSVAHQDAFAFALHAFASRRLVLKPASLEALLLQ